MARWTRRSLLRSVGVTALVGTAGCAARVPGVPPPKPRVNIGANWFEPERLVIDPGETVTWWNNEPITHTVTAYEGRIPDGADYFASGGFDSEVDARAEQSDPGILGSGDRFTHQFTVPGHYHYCCLPHEDFDTMAGRIVVRTPGGEIPAPPPVVQPDTDHVVQMGLLGFYPQSLTVRPGESVGWVNGTGIAHSVTGEDGGQAIPEGDDREFPANGEYFASGGFESAEAAVDDWYIARRGDVLPDEPFVHTFEDPGTYPYLCLLHALNMRGTVTVRDV